MRQRMLHFPWIGTSAGYNKRLNLHRYTVSTSSGSVTAPTNEFLSFLFSMTLSSYRVVPLAARFLFFVLPWNLRVLISSLYLQAFKNCTKLRDGYGKFVYLFPKDLLNYLLQRLCRGDSNIVSIGIGISGG